MRIRFTGSNNANYRIKSKGAIIITIIGATAIVAFLGVVTSDAMMKGAQATTTQGRGSNLITITGTTNDERVVILEYNHQSEICTRPGVVVSGAGVTSLGPVASCQSNDLIGWDISPDPDGINTRYRFEGNGFSTGAGGTDIAKVDDGREPDNDVYYLDANLFDLDDGPGNDRYDLVGDLLTQGVRDGILYGDTEGRDRVTFVERE